MPFVSFDENERFLRNFRAWIIGQMKVLKKSQACMGKALGISQQSFYKKLKKGNFTAAQTRIIFKELEATDKEVLRYMKM